MHVKGQETKEYYSFALALFAPSLPSSQLIAHAPTLRSNPPFCLYPPRRPSSNEKKKKKTNEGDEEKEEGKKKKLSGEEERRQNPQRRPNNSSRVVETRTKHKSDYVQYKEQARRNKESKAKNIF